jgi:hypothetical protein
MVSVMNPAKRSRARAHKNSDYESHDKCEFSTSRAGPSGGRRSSNEVIRLVRRAPRRCVFILTILGTAPPPPKPLVRGRGTAKRKQCIGYNGRLSDCTDEFTPVVEQEEGFGSIHKDQQYSEGYRWRRQIWHFMPLGVGMIMRRQSLARLMRGRLVRMVQTLSWTGSTRSEATGVQRSLCRHCHAL